LWSSHRTSRSGSSITGPKGGDQALHQPRSRRAMHHLLRGHDRAQIDRIGRGILNQARQRRETGPAMRVGKPDQPARLAQPHGPAERTLHIIGDALQLRAATGQYDLATDRAGEAQFVQRLADLPGQMFEPLANDRDELCA